MILAKFTCGDGSMVTKLMRVSALLVKVLQYAVPILLIALITYDLFKVVVGNVDEKSKKDATGKAVKRLIYAIIIFLIPTILSVVIPQVEKIAGKGGNGYNSQTSQGWLSCWNEYFTGRRK